MNIHTIIGRCALLVACTSLIAACGSDLPATPRAEPGVEPATEPARVALLQRPRAPQDTWPLSTQDVGVALDQAAGRRLRASPSGQYGLWLAPARPGTGPGGVEIPDESSSVCLRLIPLSGPNRGGGGVSCTDARRFARQQRMLVMLSAGRSGIPGIAPPHDLVLAGVVPAGVRRVRLVSRKGGSLSQRVEGSAFVFHTTRLVNRLVYRNRDGLARVPLETCQNCSGRGGPPPAPTP